MKLYAAGWNDDQINEQKSFTDGRIVVGEQDTPPAVKACDYLLRYAQISCWLSLRPRRLQATGMGFSKAGNTLGFRAEFTYPPTATASSNLTIRLGMSGNSRPTPPDELWQRLFSRKIEDEEPLTNFSPSHAASERASVIIKNRD